MTSKHSGPFDPTVLDRPRRDDGGQAFPVPAGNFSGGESWSSDDGMSLRDYFAAKVLAALAPVYGDNYGKPTFLEETRKAYRAADTMIAVRREAEPAAAEPVAAELLEALINVCRMIEIGWIPPDDLDDYKEEGVWNMACAAYRDSRVYSEARAAIAKAEGR